MFKRHFSVLQDWNTAGEKYTFLGGKHNNYVLMQNGLKVKRAQCDSFQVM